MTRSTCGASSKRRTTRRSTRGRSASCATGRKQSHWIWFVFPQIAGLGSSPMSQAYAIRSLDEARAYLAHPALGPRLRESSEALLANDPALSAEADPRRHRRDQGPQLDDPLRPRRSVGAALQRSAGPLLRREVDPETERRL